jgi:hypothetical protein
MDPWVPPPRRSRREPVCGGTQITRINIKLFLAQASNWVRRELLRPRLLTSSSLGGAAAQALSHLQTAVLIALVVGFALIVLVPEAGPLLAAVDAMGLEAFAIFVAFELRHYIVIIYRIVAATVLRGLSRWSPRPIFGPYIELVKASPRSPLTLLRFFSPNLG